LSEDHEAIREAVREITAAKITPFAAAVDAQARYPQEAHDALVASDFFAPHVPQEYGGVGADAFATCIVIEEVARGCASASLIPAVNKFGLDAAHARGERGGQGALSAAARGRGGECSPMACPSARPALTPRR
jgi:alkylation response protein AidB-like acyl-CoA dehydrogenase